MSICHWILCTFLTCFFRCPDWVKCLGQWGQACGFSPVWVYLCLFRLLMSRNPFPQNGHQCLFSPLCHLKCIFSSVLLANFFSQRLQWNGFSPVWIRMWASTSRFEKNPLLQIWQTKGLILLCTIWRCLVRPKLYTKPFPHCLQIWILPLRCTRPCRLRPLESGKRFPHSLQEKGRWPVWRLTWLSRAALLLRTRPHSPHWFLSKRQPMTDNGCNGDTTGGAQTGMGLRETLGG